LLKSVAAKCARCLQRFNDDGQFKCLYLVKENRVIDAVSGAMEEFHGTVPDK
jgi:hypothetical protein